MSIQDIPVEAKKHHLWRHTIWQTDPELHPLGAHHRVEVYCCEEANGFSVWYVRRLSHTSQQGVHDVSNGDYLLAYYGRDDRDHAITRAVQIATGASSAALQIASLDALAQHIQKI